MSILFSSAFFGIVMTLTGCMLFTSGEFSLFRTILAVLLTVGGLTLTFRSSLKWLIAVHVLAWVSALTLPLLPKPLGNLLSVLYTASLIPFVLNVLRAIIHKLVGIEDKEPSSHDREGR